MEQRGAYSQGGKGDSIGRRRGSWKKRGCGRKREGSRKRVLWQGEGRKPEKSAAAGRGKKTGKECCGREREGSRKRVLWQGEERKPEGQEEEEYVEEDKEDKRFDK